VQSASDVDVLQLLRDALLLPPQDSQAPHDTELPSPARAQDRTAAAADYCSSKRHRVILLWKRDASACASPQSQHGIIIIIIIIVSSSSSSST
jgi:hypothetical protein